MKNVVFVIESLHLGGAEKSLVTLLQNIDYKEYSVDLILFSTDGIFLNQVPKQVQIIQIKVPHLSIFKRVQYKVLRMLNVSKFHDAQLLWSLIKNNFLNNKKKYDIAIAYNQGFATYYVSTYVNATFNFAWLNTDYQKAGYNITYDYPYYKKFNSVVAVSSDAKKALEAELEIISKKLPITIIKDITDKKRVIQLAAMGQKLRFLPDKINIVTVGRLAKHKGLHLAIKSCKNLINQGYNVNWYVIGEGSQRSYLNKLVEENCLVDSFFLVGALENPYTYMKACDVYVQTSLFEGLGLTVIEAAILNKPIVSTNFPTAKTIITHNETGLICEMTPESIASAVLEYINNPSLVKKITGNLQEQINNDKEKTLHEFNKLLAL